jgi:hypothetical protein
MQCAFQPAEGSVPRSSSSELPAELALGSVVRNVAGDLTRVRDADDDLAADGKIEAGFGKQTVTCDRHAPTSGARPADLPVQLPSKFACVINLATAKGLVLPVTPKLLVIANEVIE